VVIGCGGNGGGGSVTNGGNGGGGGVGDGLRVTIPTPPGQQYPYGALEFSYLTGQGRAVGDLMLSINRIFVQDEFGLVRTDLNDRVDLLLNSFSFQTIRMNVPFTGQDSRHFEGYVLDPAQIQEELLGGASRTVTRFGVNRGGGTSWANLWPPRPLPINARVFPGRSTSVPIYIDDSMFRFVADDLGNPVAVFDEDRFEQVNQAPVNGFLNDYVMFDISGMPANERPIMSNGDAVTKVFVSGDNYSVASTGTVGAFEMLTLEVAEPIVGTFGSPGTIGNVERPGTFTLEQLDPTDLENLRRIVALQGMWRPFTSVMTGFGTWNFITFPTREDGARQEAVLFRHQNGVINTMYYGEVRMDTGEFDLYPIRTLVQGIVPDEQVVSGSITAAFDRNNSQTQSFPSVRSGNFQINSRAQLPADAPNTGRFLVFRI
jgi:hypothetical protein